MHYDTIEEAYHFVNGARFGERRALLHRRSGKAYYTSTVADYGELPADVENSSDYIAVPHEKDLPLGQPVVIDFVQEHCPQQMTRIMELFERKDAYRHLKDLLTRIGLIETWYLYEDAREREELQNWCREHDLSLD
jgi:hypothetical protein